MFLSRCVLLYSGRTLLYRQSICRQSTKSSQDTKSSQSALPPIVLGEHFLFKIGWHPSCLTVSEDTKNSTGLHRKWWLYTPASTLNHTCLGGKCSNPQLHTSRTTHNRRCTGIFAWSIFNAPLSSLHVCQFLFCYHRFVWSLGVFLAESPACRGW